MADTNDDEWLYGAEGDREAPMEQDAPQQDESDSAAAPVKSANNNDKTFETFDEQNFEEAGDEEQLQTEDSKDVNEESNQDPEEEDSDDDDDDDINVVIGDIKSGGTAAYVKGGQDQKQKQPGSKFNIEEFESVGTINGQPAFEFSLESIEDKPWRKPGADITDYFNYGFNEETWRSYCERQKRIRIHESGIGLASLTAAQNPGGNHHQGSNEGGGGGGGGGRPYINIGMNKGMGGRGPRPPRPGGTIDVIGAPSQNSMRPMAPRENVIQVMTADRREYSRTVVNQNPQMPLQFNVPPEDFYNAHHDDQDNFNYGYEPTQDGNQWEGGSNWAPSEIKELTPMNQPPPGMHGTPPLNIPPPLMQMMPPQNMIPPLMGQMPMIKQEMEDKRDNRRMGRDNRDNFRDDRRHEDRKRMRERSTSREREMRKTERPPRDDRPPRTDRDRYTRESSSRSGRRSKSRDRTTKRSKSRDRKRSRSRDHKTDERAGRSDKTKRERPKKEEV